MCTTGSITSGDGRLPSCDVGSKSIKKERFRYGMRNMTIKKWVALILKIILAAVVAIFLGAESLNFFYFIFPADQWYLAYTGFGLTMGAMFVYFYLFLFDAETSLQRTIAIIMAIAGLVGELAAAGFGMQIEAWRKSGYALTESNYDLMILVVRILMLLHGVALGMYWAGDRVIEILEESTGKDINNDGNVGKPKRDNQSHNAPRSRQEAPRATQQQQGTSYTLEQFCAQIGLTPDQARNIASATTDHNTAFDWLVVGRNMSDNTDISGKNFRKIFYRDLNPPVAAGVNGKNQP
jgi:hypothetical protein